MNDYYKRLRMTIIKQQIIIAISEQGPAPSTFIGTSRFKDAAGTGFDLFIFKLWCLYTFPRKRNKPKA